MARFCADENFPFPVVEELRQLGHDVLTTEDSGRARQAVPDEAVLTFASSQGRAVLTMNRKHFIHLHSSRPDHSGIIVFALALVLAACSDPAVRVARCLESAATRILEARQGRLDQECDTGLAGRYAVVLVPAQEISNRALGRAGVSEAVIEAVRELEFSSEPHEAVVVVPLEGQRRASRTTYQRRFVVIQDLLVVEKVEPRLRLGVEDVGGQVEVVAVE